MTRKNTKSYDIPSFKDLKEEDKFWQNRSPLLEEAKPEQVQRKRQNRSSFISIRLTGEELSFLREQAISYGLAPSTYARQIIIQAMESHKGGTIPPDSLIRLFHRLSGVRGEPSGKYLEKLTTLYGEYAKAQELFTGQFEKILFDAFMSRMIDPEEIHKLIKTGTGDVMKAIDKDFISKESGMSAQTREVQK